VLHDDPREGRGLFKEVPDEQMPVAPEALEAVERYAQTLKVLRTGSRRRAIGN
jgi:hypothetical protein